MWTLAGEEATVSVDLKVDGQFVVPDEGSLRVTIRDNTGGVLLGWNKTKLEDTDRTQVLLTLSEEVTTLDVTAQIGALYLKVDWAFEGSPQSSSRIIRLARFAPIQATPESVRNRLGAQEHEIPDSSIDLYSAYYKLLPLYSDTLPSALSSSVALACISANNAIELQAALSQLPALAAKLSQIETQENTSITRMKLDLNKLERDLTNSLQQELVNMEETLLGITTSSSVTLLLLTSPTDPITG